MRVYSASMSDGREGSEDLGVESASSGVTAAAPAAAAAAEVVRVFYDGVCIVVLCVCVYMCVCV